MENTPSLILSLYKDLLASCFQFLEEKELRTTSKVNKLFYHNITTNPLCWKYIRFHFNSFEKSFPSLIRILILDIHNHDTIRNDNIEEEKEKKLLLELQSPKFKKQIEELIIHSLPSRGIKHIMMCLSFPNLKKLEYLFESGMLGSFLLLKNNLFQSCKDSLEILILSDYIISYQLQLKGIEELTTLKELNLGAFI